MKKLNIDYTATVVNTGGRNGHVQSEDGLIDFEVAMPKEIGGKGGKINAEELFAAAYASCFGSTLAHQHCIYFKAIRGNVEVNVKAIE